MIIVSVHTKCKLAGELNTFEQCIACTCPNLTLSFFNDAFIVIYHI